MNNGSWVGIFIPIPFVLLLLGISALVILVGVAFAFNQIVGLIISGTSAYIRDRQVRRCCGIAAHRRCRGDIDGVYGI